METFYSHAPDTNLPPFSDSLIEMILGKKFQPEKDESSNSETKIQCTKFINQVQSLFWFTYRKDFPLLGGVYTSDMGWGCMLRSAQMIVCQTLFEHFSRTKFLNPTEEEKKKVLKYFSDSPKEWLSIHSISQCGIRFGKKIGEWFGPSTASLVLAEIMNQANLDGIVTYVSNDATLYIDEITGLCKNSSSWKSIFILIHLRLGLDKINPVYIDSIKHIFQIPQNVGILGGRPRSAFYFVACQDDYLFYLDPHIVQSTVSMDEDFSTSSFHSPCPQKMPISSLDPSIALGFYCSNEQDFQDFCERVQKISRMDNCTPLFYIEQASPDYKLQKQKETKELEEDFIIIENS